MPLSPSSTPLRRIDTHHHVVPHFYRDWLVAQGITAGGREIPTWDPETALAFMDDTQVQTAILSVSTPGVGFAPTSEARQMAREVNDYCAGLAADHDGRFGFFATVMQADRAHTIEETSRALDELHADGVVLLTNTDGTYLGDPSQDYLMEMLNERHAVAFVHPSELPAEPVAGIAPYVADFLLDTTRAAINIARHGVLDRYPNISFILSHAGGFVPFAAARIARAASPDFDQADGEQLLRRFYFDTALSASASSLPSLLAFAGADRVLYGSDFPYAPAGRSSWFTQALDDYEPIDHAAVNRVNAERLLARSRSAAATSAGAAQA